MVFRQLCSHIVAFFLLFHSLGTAESQEVKQGFSSASVLRVIVNRVDVSVTVTNSEGRFIEGLQRKDFHVFDNGVEQPITDFLPIDESSRVVLVVECGPAVLLLGKSLLRAADTLVSNLGPSDSLAVVCYSDTPQLLIDFTTDKPGVRQALRNLNFMAGSGQLNLSGSIATVLDWLATVPGKKTIVLLATGVDTSPVANWNPVQKKMLASDVPILSVSMLEDFRKPAKHNGQTSLDRFDRALLKQTFAEADQTLRQLSAATGGRVFFPKNASECDRAYAQLAQLVRHEYSIAFSPPVLDGQLHSIKVSVRHAWCKVDHRRAYFAPTPPLQ